MVHGLSSNGPKGTGFLPGSRIAYTDFMILTLTDVDRLVDQELRSSRVSFRTS